MANLQPFLPGDNYRSQGPARSESHLPHVVSALAGMNTFAHGEEITLVQAGCTANLGLHCHFNHRPEHWIDPSVAASTWRSWGDLQEINSITARPAKTYLLRLAPHVLCSCLRAHASCWMQTRRPTHLSLGPLPATPISTLMDMPILILRHAAQDAYKMQAGPVPLASAEHVNEAVFVALTRPQLTRKPPANPAQTCRRHE